MRKRLGLEEWKRGAIGVAECVVRGVVVLECMLQEGEEVVELAKGTRND